MQSMYRYWLLIPLLLQCGFAWSLPQHLPAPGGIAVIPLPAGNETARVFFNEKPQAVVTEKGKTYALIGIPLDTTVGRQLAEIRQNGHTIPVAFEVLSRHYATQKLRIPDKRMVTPPPEVEARIASEHIRLTEFKNHFSDTAPETAFTLPATGRLSSRFGLKRVLNGEPRSPHAGLDLAIGTGTPVRAPAAGTVLAVEDFYFTGGTVIIDHGQGLLTLYAHLSKVDVTPGQKLQQNEAFAASGVSGRITGPHLHWVVLLGGTAVEPELFLPGKVQ